MEAMSTWGSTGLCCWGQRWSRHSSGGVRGVLNPASAAPHCLQLDTSTRSPSRFLPHSTGSRGALSPAGSVHQQCVQCPAKGQELHRRAVPPTLPSGSAKNTAGQTQPPLPLLQNPPIPH